MLIFVDTEFTDFTNPELISIALVTDDGQHEFYAELPVDQQRCNTFVIETVLPQLGNIDGAQCDVNELAKRLGHWLGQFAARSPVICFDFDGDWHLFCRALHCELPDWLQGKNVFTNLDPVAVQMYFIENGLRDHHALNDARANRHAYRGDFVRLRPTQFRKSR
jgi:hypothetical protein